MPVDSDWPEKSTLCPWPLGVPTGPVPTFTLLQGTLMLGEVGQSRRRKELIRKGEESREIPPIIKHALLSLLWLGVQSVKMITYQYEDPNPDEL